MVMMCDIVENISKIMVLLYKSEIMVLLYKSEIMVLIYQRSLIYRRSHHKHESISKQSFAWKERFWRAEVMCRD